jgi:hypothetical protein
MSGSGATEMSEGREREKREQDEQIEKREEKTSETRETEKTKMDTFLMCLYSRRANQIFFWLHLFFMVNPI